MSKKIFSMIIVIVMVLSCLASCAPTYTEEELVELGWVKDPANNGWVKDPANNGWVKDPAGNGWVKDPANNGWVKDPASNGWIPGEQYIPAPVITGKVMHWVPGAQEANVSYDLDLGGQTEYKVIFNGELLQEFVDYTYDSETKGFEVLGTTLFDMGLGLGEYLGLIVTKGGYAEFNVVIVPNAAVEGSTIPLKEVNGINLSGFKSAAITEPIAGAADLFITEMSADMGNFNYVEVFNNTTSAYNLKDHRIVFANLDQQTVSGQFEVNGVFDKPLGGASAAYIYQDFEIPALSSAIIWIVNTAPWEMKSNKIVEASNIQSLLLGNGEENLNVAKFREVYGLDESALVFPVRTNYMLGRSDYGTLTGGWGTALCKSASNRWADINSSVAKRGVQIQRINENKVFETEDGKFYTIEFDVVNREEDIYADGVLDANDVLVTNPGVAVAGTNREVIHALFARRVYVTSQTDLTPTGQALVTADGIDLYNCANAAGSTNYTDLFVNGVVTPVATALIYPNLVPSEEDPSVEVAAKWGNTYTTFGMQYQAPAKGEHMSKFIPLEGYRAKYDKLYEGQTYILSGLANERAGYAANSVVMVPVSPAYPTDYLSQNHNTIGRVTELMIP